MEEDDIIRGTTDKYVSKFKTSHNEFPMIAATPYEYPGNTCVIHSFSKLETMNTANQNLDSTGVTQDGTEITSFLKICTTAVDNEIVRSANVITDDEVNVVLSNVDFCCNLIEPSINRKTFLAPEPETSFFGSSVKLQNSMFCSSAIVYACICPPNWTSKLVSGQISGDYLTTTIGEVVRKTGIRIAFQFPMYFSGYRSMKLPSICLPPQHKLIYLVQYTTPQSAINHLSHEYDIPVDQLYVMASFSLYANITYETLNSTILF